MISGNRTLENSVCTILNTTLTIETNTPPAAIFPLYPYITHIIPSNDVINVTAELTASWEAKKADRIIEKISNPQTILQANSQASGLLPSENAFLTDDDTADSKNAHISVKNDLTALGNASRKAFAKTLFKPLSCDIR